MENKRKILIKQTSIVVTALALCWIGYWIDFNNYIILWGYSFVGLLFFIPIIALYFIKIKKDVSFGRLGVIFDIVAWLSIAFFMLHTLYGLSDIFYTQFPEVGMLKNMWFNIQSYFYPPYWFDLEYGLLYDLQELLFYSPYLIVSALLYWAIRVNRKLDK